jgi:uncharacterized protein YhbP (UPF0306 family)
MTDAISTPGVPRQIIDFLSHHTTMTLATASPTGLPRATTLRYASDGVTLYVWTHSQSWTARQIEQNPLVSFTIAEETTGVQGTGEARLVLAGREISRAVELFSEKFPMALGVSTMNISFFRIAPTDVKLIDESYAGGRGETRIFEGAEYRVEEAYTVTSELPTGDVGLVSGKLQRVELEPGAVIARQGAPADKFMIVIDGEVEVVREGEQGRDTVDTLRAGDFFGEIAVLRESPRSATLRARTAATVLTMDRDQFKSVVAQGLGVTFDFDRIIRERLGG